MTAFNPEPREEQPVYGDVTECGRCDATHDGPRVEAEWHGWQDSGDHGIVCPACVRYAEFTRAAQARQAAWADYPAGREGEPTDDEIYGG